MPRLILIFLFFVLTSVGSHTLAQSPQKKYFLENIETNRFDDQKYKELTEGVDFLEEKKEEKKKEKKEKKEAPPVSFEGIGPLLKFIFITLAIILLVIILIKALTGDNIFSPKNNKIKPATQIDLQKIEDNLEDAQLDHPIQQAIATGDYPLAVRLYYLAVLQNLALNKKIKWKKDKTNGEYLRELAGTPIFTEMQKTTLIFERVWYGEINIDQADFLKIEQLFLKMLPKSPGAI